MRPVLPGPERRTRPNGSCEAGRGCRRGSPVGSTTSLTHWSCAPHGGSRPLSPVFSSTCPGFWSCAAPSKTRPRWPRKSVPTTPNASWATSHGSWERGGREHQRRDTRLGLLGLQAAALQAVRDEVIGITTSPGGLRLDAARHLTRRCGTRPLTTTHTAVGHKPVAADAAGPLREHPQMLASIAGNQRGPLLASNPGSILASAEAAYGRSSLGGHAKALRKNRMRFHGNRTTLQFLGGDLDGLHAERRIRSVGIVHDLLKAS
jgi:hypothetical protein